MSRKKDVNMCFAHEWRVINSSLTRVTIAETQVITQVTITSPCLVYKCHCLFSGEESILPLISQILIFFFLLSLQLILTFLSLQLNKLGFVFFFLFPFIIAAYLFNIMDNPMSTLMVS